MPEFNRVRTNSVYRYCPVAIDRIDKRNQQIPEGALLRVVRLHGCPPPGTMGHCHVTSVDDTGLWLVCVNSLVSRK